MLIKSNNIAELISNCTSFQAQEIVDIHQQKYHVYQKSIEDDLIFYFNKSFKSIVTLSEFSFERISFKVFALINTPFGVWIIFNFYCARHIQSPTLNHFPS